jgi:hypothetical protein
MPNANAARGQGLNTRSRGISTILFAHSVQVYPCTLAASISLAVHSFPWWRTASIFSESGNAFSLLLLSGNGNEWPGQAGGRGRGECLWNGRGGAGESLSRNECPLVRRRRRRRRVAFQGASGPMRCPTRVRQAAAAAPLEPTPPPRKRLSRTASSGARRRSSARLDGCAFTGRRCGVWDYVRSVGLLPLHGMRCSLGGRDQGAVSVPIRQNAAKYSAECSAECRQIPQN